MARRLSRRQKNRWFFIRFDVLVMEGFSPEESNLMSYTRISSPGVRRLRYNRKRMVAREISNGLTHREAVESVRKHVANTDIEVVDWDAFRRLVYR